LSGQSLKIGHSLSIKLSVSKLIFACLLSLLEKLKENPNHQKISSEKNLFKIL